jgi:orotate phosphoribosyltransferase
MGVIATASVKPSEDTSRLIELLKELALEKGNFVLSSGESAKYFVDAKRVTARGDGYRIIGRLIAEQIHAHHATAVGGLTLGADAIAYSALSVIEHVKVFVVRKEPKAHGLHKQLEGAVLDPSADRCLVVDDVVTTGQSTIKAINVLRSMGLTICGVVCLVDRLAGGGDKIRGVIGDASYVPLTTIDDVYPDRPDRYA